MYDNLRFEYAHFNSMDFGSYGLGASVSPMGSQLMTTNTAINWGLQNLEVNLGTQMNFQQAGHLAQLGKIEREELIRLAKLNKVNLSLHAPLLSPEGLQGNKLDEVARIKNEKEFEQTIDFADQIGRQTGKKHVPVTFHSSSAPIGSPMPKEMIYAVNQESGEVVPIEKKKVAYPKEFFQRFDLKEGVDYEPVKGQPGYYYIYPQGELKLIGKKQLESVKYEEAHTDYWVRHYKEALIQRGLDLSGDPKKLKEEAKRMGRDILELYRNYEAHLSQKKNLEAQIMDLRKKYEKDGQIQILAPAEEYAKEKMKKTFVELGLKAYEKPSKPMIVIENFYPEFTLSHPEKLAKTIEEIRQELANRLVKEKGLSKSKAIKEAQELIGMNVDIGHLNLWKKYTNPKTGKPYTNKEIIEWVNKVYPYIKHVHVTDNWGDYDAHLPVGWGNAPVNEFIDTLRKKGWKGRAILETFGTPQFGGTGGFGVAQSIYSLGIPLVPGGPGWEMAEGTYFQSGYAFTTGPILPDVNFQTYGVGFSGLPYATGGQIGGGKPGQKFAGTPMS
jgi:hypothetical protein